MLTYDQMNEIAAYGGFPNRYPHWRFGMEYEQLAKSYEYGLSKIYEMVINNNPVLRLPARGQLARSIRSSSWRTCTRTSTSSRTTSRFRSTDLDATRPHRPGAQACEGYDPNRRWIDKMANHGSRIRRARRSPRHRQGRRVHRSVPLAREPDRSLGRRSWRAPRRSPTTRTSTADRSPAPARQGLHGVVHQPRGVPRGAAQEDRREARAREALPRAARARRLDVPARPRAARALGARRARVDPRRGLLLLPADADEDHERGLGHATGTPR